MFVNLQTDSMIVHEEDYIQRIFYCQLLPLLENVASFSSKYYVQLDYNYIWFKIKKKQFNNTGSVWAFEWWMKGRARIYNNYRILVRVTRDRTDPLRYW